MPTSMTSTNPQAPRLAIGFARRMHLAVALLAALFHTGCAFHASSSFRRSEPRRTARHAHIQAGTFESIGWTDRATHQRWGILADVGMNVSQEVMPLAGWRSDRLPRGQSEGRRERAGFDDEPVREKYNAHLTTSTIRADATSSFDQVADADEWGTHDSVDDGWNDHDAGAEALGRMLLGGWWKNWKNRTSGGLSFDTVSCSNTNVKWRMPIGGSSGGGGGWRPNWWPFKKNSSSSSAGSLTSQGKLTAHRGMLAGGSRRSITWPWKRNSSSTLHGLGGVAGQLGAANGDYGVTLWPITQSSTRQCGTCSSVDTAVTINVKTASDFQRRLNHDPSKTVKLVLQNDITLSKGQNLTFDSGFSCTILTSAPDPRKPNGFTIAYGSDDAAALAIIGASNVIALRVSFKSQAGPSSAKCAFADEFAFDSVCPTVLVLKSYGVQIGKADVFGRIDIVRSMYVRVDSIKGTASRGDTFDFGLIRVAFSGIALNSTASNILITNNELYGVSMPVNIGGGATGVGVYNNYVHDFGFAGISMGFRMSEVMTASFVDVSQNLIIAKGRNVTGDSDAAGIYWNTKWFSPGNTATCNYVFNGDHCMYLDNLSTDIQITGGACVNTRDGMKINNGQRNVIKDVVMKNVTGAHAWCSCLFWNVHSCIRHYGKVWTAMQQRYWNAPDFRATYPWWSTMCSRSTANNGKSCNPSGAVAGSLTGRCSGLPVDNKVDLVTVANPKNRPAYFTYMYCDDHTGVPNVNAYSSVDITDATTAGFNNYPADDLGIKAASSMNSARPQFTSCPRKYVGQQKFSLNSYYWNFNIPKPDLFDTLVTMSTVSILNHTLAGSFGWP